MSKLVTYVIYGAFSFSAIYLLAWLTGDNPDDVVGWYVLGGLVVLIVEKKL